MSRDRPGERMHLAVFLICLHVWCSSNAFPCYLFSGDDLAKAASEGGYEGLCTYMRRRAVDAYYQGFCRSMQLSEESVVRLAIYKLAVKQHTWVSKEMKNLHGFNVGP